MTRCRRSRPEDQRGSAVVDFVLVSLILVPLVLGLIQVGLVLHVRNTLSAAVTEGARYAATADRDPAAGAERARAQIRGALAARFADHVVGEQVVRDGLVLSQVRAEAAVPALGLWGPSVRISVVGHGVEEQP